MSNRPRIAYAGDREIAVRVLDFLIREGTEPLALLVSSPPRATHSNALFDRVPNLDPRHIMTGKEFLQPENLETLRLLDLDFVVSVHFPYIVPPNALEIARLGWLNLHPSLLPFNRGWHTPSWTILDQTPAGATLHFMDEGLDTGDVVASCEVDVSPGDTADSLYQRLLSAELAVFRRAWPELAAGHYQRRRQDPAAGSRHVRSDLLEPAVQRLDLDAKERVESLLRRLRALTTNDISEAAYFEANGRKFRVQVRIMEEEDPARPRPQAPDPPGRAQEIGASLPRGEDSHHE